MRTITKVMTRTNWEAFKLQKEWKEPSLLEEGFIHCSFRNQSIQVANKHFTNESDVVLLILDPALVQAEMKYEIATNGQEYPHIYGPLHVDSVTAVVPFKKLADGSFALPDEWKEEK